MSAMLEQFRPQLKTLNELEAPKTGRLIAWLLVVFIGLSLAVLWFTPWVQTAYGAGIVSTMNPQQRMQAISALVPGQIKEWHVQEGQKVKKGDPIVTLVDTDQQLIERLQTELAAVEQQHNANQGALNAAQQDYSRQNNLYEQGLVSKRKVEQAQIRVESRRVELAKTEVALNRAKVNLARQSIQTKMAPMDGTITRLHSAGIATWVKAGDMLATFIPDRVERAVVLSVRGLDAPLVQPGRSVRLQFDGWPVFQFSGWPSAAVGTFAGVVEFIEPMANQTGRFNVWVKEDPRDKPWPDETFARLGSKAKGWVLLEEVQLGYEIWRQLNNFPPDFPQQVQYPLEDLVSAAESSQKGGKSDANK